MPIFLDPHDGADLPLDTLRRFLRAARGALPAESAVRPLDLYCGDDGRIFFVVAAPDEAAVRQHHAAEGALCRGIRRVASRRPGGEHLGEEEKATVRQMIVAEQARAWRP
jgi:hypothetical protein